MISGALGIFSIFSIQLSFLSILMFVAELACYILIGYRLFFLIGDFSLGLATAAKS